MLAIASQAQKEGYADKENIKDELKNLEKSLLAQNYDRKINSDKGPMPPFGFITEDRVKEFWGEGKDMSGLSWIWNGAESRRREAEFAAFINPKIELAKKNGQIPKDQEPSESDLKQARDAFAKTYIYYKEAKDKLANLSSLSPEEQKEWKEWKEKTELQIKIQKASFITSNYAKDVLSKKFEVTDEEVEKYMADNPELVNTEEKKKKAEEILQKVKEGGDFAELATEFSEDPGSKNKGGLYEGIGKGQFAPEFEKAAMALEPGEVNDTVVETNFGYHIIKLVKKGERKGANGQEQPTYDVRHILISTMVKDPDNPAAREMPAEQLARTKLQKEKQEKILAEIKENNPVEFPEDFDIPEVSEEDLKKQQEEQMQQMQQMQQQQQGGPKPPPGAPPKPAPKPADKPAEKPAAPNAEKK
jgi:parvulin-like peptidyl-prolyl isomerase